MTNKELIKLSSITEDLQIVNISPILWIKSIRALVIADLHLGIESIMAEEGAFSPKKQTQEIIELLSNILSMLKPFSLILNGDIKHSFNQPSKIENREVKDLLSALSIRVPTIYVIQGNHDIYINWITRNYENVVLSKELHLDNYYFTHGDEPLPEFLPSNVKYVIIGHEHPIFQQKVRGLETIKMPCFALGELKNRTAKILVTPAFTPYSSGTPINPTNKDNLLSPILLHEVDISSFELFVLSKDDDVISFPPFKLWY